MPMLKDFINSQPSSPLKGRQGTAQVVPFDRMEAGARDPSTAELRAAQPATPALRCGPRERGGSVTVL